MRRNKQICIIWRDLYDVVALAQLLGAFIEHNPIFVQILSLAH